jgi:glycosyltransferase involved in cell wall biosynthesis
MKVCYFLSHYRSHEISGQNFIGCLRRAGVEVVRSPEEADAVVIHNEIPTFPGYYRMHPALRGRRVIAYAVWETDRLPEHHRFCLSLATEMWTCTDYCRDVLVQAGRPVSLVPHVVVPPARDAAAEARMRARIGHRDGEFLFYTIVRSAANVRKGVPDAIHAFAEAFPGGEARLVVKTAVPLPPQLAAVPGVVSIAEPLPAEDVAALHHVADCCVSAHRSEGWGLTLSDAMAAGRMVVATAHGGNTEFMNEGNSLPVACNVEPVRAAEAATQPGLLDTAMRWGYPDREHLTRQMRRAFHEREALAPLREQARRDMAAFAPERIAEVLAARLGAG